MRRPAPEMGGCLGHTTGEAATEVDVAAEGMRARRAPGSEPASAEGRPPGAEARRPRGADQCGGRSRAQGAGGCW
ncbi:hypothetical protein E2562_036912 [Oryza meyeriana var. granulata]|uniref:Uncharacterized protein n=1 Tax=Oryza meyeriana var. granulata TaxID=110450 RepID=A0A6G1CM88_9ORYZ|nr:hypothetical protein E2562_036912 [Oryza meyeriana var. granulata]